MFRTDLLGNSSLREWSCLWMKGFGKVDNRISYRSGNLIARRVGKTNVQDSTVKVSTLSVPGFSVMLTLRSHLSSPQLCQWLVAHPALPDPAAQVFEYLLHISLATRHAVPVVIA